MSRENYSELLSFIAVAKARSFTRAATQLGVSQSALSHTVKNLEQRLGLRLLNRTTRSVSLTEVGERLFSSVTPKFDDIDRELNEVSELRDKPTGTVRISAGDHAIDTVIWPKLEPVLREHPDIRLELAVDYNFTDIVEHRFDAGVRFGEAIAKDMIAVRIGPDLSLAAVATPDYFKRHGTPREPRDLVRHRCINLRFNQSGNLYVWEFEKDGQALNVNVDGQLVFNGVTQITRAALQGFGIAYLQEDIFQPYLASGQLVRVLEDWSPPFSGYHLYFPNRMRASPAFDIVVNALRHRD